MFFCRNLRQLAQTATNVCRGAGEEEHIRWRLSKRVAATATILTATTIHARRLCASLFQETTVSLKLSLFGILGGHSPQYRVSLLSRV